MLRNHAVGLAILAGGFLPLLTGLLKSNHKCVFYSGGCFADYSCTTGGTCPEGAVKKRGTGALYGGCVSRNGFTCNETTVNCYVEISYSDSGCSTICATAYNTITGCN